MNRILILLIFILFGLEYTNGIVVQKDTDIDKKTIESNNFLLYIGTYTDGNSQGIYVSEFNADSATLSTPKLVANIDNPSFQCVTPNKKQLWSVSESWKGMGQVIGFTIDPVSGDLTKIKDYSSNGYSTCYVSYHQPTKNVFAASYKNGNVIKIPVTKAGLPKGKPFNHQHMGTGPNKSRQEGPHAHCIKFDLDGKYAYSCDLGSDKIYVYTIEGNKLKVFKEIKTAPGAGPRHLDFQPQKKAMAVVHELNGTVVTYLPDTDGCFSIEHTTISTVPDDFKGQSKCADIHFTPNGKFLYASNRGNNSIVIFKMNDETTPELVDWQTQNLMVTRNFTIDPSGRFLIAANQDGNSVVVFKIDQLTGKLNFTGNQISISKPVCVTLLEK